MSLNTGTPLIAEARAENGALVAKLAGDLSIVNAPELRVALANLVEDQKPGKVVLNFSDVRYVDSGSLGVLIETHKLATKHGGNVVLTNLTKELRGLISIMKLDAVFTLADDEAAALAG